MNIFEFGDAKLQRRDIDPLYFALVDARRKLSMDALCRYTLAEVAFDHAGVAARITEAGSAGFWPAMFAAAHGTTRGAPRRYYRGAIALRSMEQLSTLYPDGACAVQALGGSFAQAQKVVLSWLGWGVTAAFKLCDMAERVCARPIDFSSLSVDDLCSSVQVAKGLDKARGKLTQSAMFAKLVNYKWATAAGPRYDRPIGIQELETICCYYSHDPQTSKHLPGMDALGVYNELKGYGMLAERIARAIPREGDYIDN